MAPRDLTRDALRREMRRHRRMLSVHDRVHASKRFQTIAKRHRLFRPGMRVALYLAYGHEASCASLIDLALMRGCGVYVPRIESHHYGRMRFEPFATQAALIENRHGISEPPRSANHIPVRCLDLMVLPVVAVDQRGFRLGSGAGFYDRALQHLRQGRRWRRPKLVALAYEVQRIEHLPSRSWDVPVDAVLTEKQLYRISTGHPETHT